MYVREPFVAGRFYTRNGEELAKEISGYLEKADIKPKDEVCAVIAPHAGYLYSGQIAAYAYKLIAMQEYDTFIVLAPSHYERFAGVSIIPDGLFRTPLGDMQIDAQFSAELMKCEAFTFIENAHTPEHSLEVQVPFIQTVAPKSKLVALVLSNSSLDLMKLVAEKIASAAAQYKKKILLVISSDLSHFHPYDEAVARDSKLIRTLEHRDPELLKNVINEGYAAACGEAPLLTGLYYAGIRGNYVFRKLAYANSADTSGDRSRVVGYLAAALEIPR